MFRTLKTLVETLVSLCQCLGKSPNMPVTFFVIPEFRDTLPDIVLEMFNDFSKSHTRLDWPATSKLVSNIFQQVTISHGRAAAVQGLRRRDVPPLCVHPCPTLRSMSLVEMRRFKNM